MARDDYGEEWWREVDHAGRPLKDLFGEFADLGLGPPDTWTKYDVHIDRGGDIEAIIHDNAGNEFSLSDRTDFEDDSWSWVWDIWEWLDTEYDDFDMETTYAED